VRRISNAFDRDCCPGIWDLELLAMTEAQCGRGRGVAADGLGAVSIDRSGNRLGCAVVRCVVL
jgi:hypothetical protein